MHALLSSVEHIRPFVAMLATPKLWTVCRSIYNSTNTQRNNVTCGHQYQQQQQQQILGLVCGAFQCHFFSCYTWLVDWMVSANTFSALQGDLVCCKILFLLLAGPIAVVVVRCYDKS